MLSAVAMSKPTPPAGAGTDSETTKFSVVVPALPSTTDASAMVSAGSGGPPCGVTVNSSIERPWSLPE